MFRVRWTLSTLDRRWPVAEFRSLRDALDLWREYRHDRHLGVVITIRRD